MFEHLKERIDEPVSNEWADRLICFALVVWTCGQLLFVDSAIGQSSFVLSNGLKQLHVAIVMGCLMVALAIRGVDFKPLATVALFGTLFAAMTTWYRGGQNGPIVVLLFAILAKDMDIEDLASKYLIGVIIGIAGVLLCAALGLIKCTVFLTQNSPITTIGFNYPSFLWSLLLSICVALALVSRGDHSHLVIALCTALAIISLLLTHFFVASLLMVAVGAFTFLYAHYPNSVTSALQRPYVRLAIAVLPFVLLCHATDGSRYFGFAHSATGFTSMVKTFGYAVVICMSVLYIRSVFLAKPTFSNNVLLASCVFFSLSLLTSAAPMHLELNCSLLVFSRGLCDHSSLMLPLLHEQSRSDDTHMETEVQN